MPTARERLIEAIEFHDACAKSNKGRSEEEAEAHFQKYWVPDLAYKTGDENITVDDAREQHRDWFHNGASQWHVERASDLREVLGLEDTQ